MVSSADRAGCRWRSNGDAEVMDVGSQQKMTGPRIDSPVPDFDAPTWYLGRDIGEHIPFVQVESLSRLASDRGPCGDGRRDGDGDGNGDGNGYGRRRGIMGHTSWLIVGGLAVLFMGCGEDEGPTSKPDAAADADSGAVDSGDDLVDVGTEDSDDVGVEGDTVEENTEGSVRWGLAAALEDDFFAFPYPSDLRKTALGGPDLRAFPAWRSSVTLLSDALDIIHAEAVGFSPMSAVYIGFHVDLDAATLPDGVDATLGDDASVYLLDVTPGSPQYGQRIAAVVTYNAAGGGYWDPRTLAIRPLYQLPLRTRTTYAAVVTTSVRGADGGALTPPNAIRRFATDAGDGSPNDESMTPLRDALTQRGIPLETVLAATVFTTGDPAHQLRSLAEWLENDQPVPPVSGLEIVQDDARFDVYEGWFDSEEFFSGVAPYRNFGDGRISVGENGAPETRTPAQLRFALSVPKGEMPDEGWPVVLYGHGLGEDYRGFVRVAAGPLADRGIAVFGIDPPLQGGRNPTGEADRDLIVNLSITNIVAGREILRQAVCDTIQASRLVKSGLTIPAEISSTGQEVRLSSSKIGFFGHSEGAQVGALFLALHAGVDVGVLSEGGAGGAITLLELRLPDFDVAALVALALGIDNDVETFDLEHPVVNVVIQPLLDPADPLHVARHIFLEPQVGGPVDLVMLEGFNDPLTPPPAIEALASVAGLPIAEPVGREIDGLSRQGVQSVPLPAADNLQSVDGETATGALLQFPDGDHYMIYRDANARWQLFEFVRTGLVEGRTVVGPPP